MLKVFCFNLIIYRFFFFLECNKKNLIRFNLNLNIAFQLGIEPMILVLRAP